MKKLFVSFAILGLLLPTIALAAPVSWDRFQVGKIRPINVLDTVYANLFVGTSTAAASIFPYASSTAWSSAYASSSLWFGGGLGTCNGSNFLQWTSGVFGCAAAGAGADFPFTPTTNFGQVANSTSTAIWFRGSPFSLFASSTAWFANAFAVNATSTVSQYFPYLGTAAGTFLAVDEAGKLIATSTPSAGSGTVTSIATTFPILGGPITTTGTISFGGLSTSSPWTQGQLAYVQSNNQVTSVATTTLSATSPVTLSGTTVVLGASPLTVACATCATQSQIFGKSWELTTNTFGQSALAPTTTQNIAVNGVGTSTFAGGIEAWRSIGAPYFNATSSTATSTFAGNAVIQGNLQVNGQFFAPVSIVSSGNATINGNLTVTGQTTLATSLTGFLKGASGVVSAVASIVASDISLTKGNFLVGNDSGVAQATSTIFISSTGSVGHASTTPWGLLSIEQGTEAISFVVSNQGSTSPSLIVTGVNNNGRVGIGTTTPFAKFSIGAGNSAVIAENTIATSTTITMDWRNGVQQLVRMGAAGTTINFTGYIEGAILRVVLCNPNAVSGAITWDTIVLWPAGTVPTKTTTANKCDLYTFIATNGTSTLKIFGGQVANF